MLVIFTLLQTSPRQMWEKLLRCHKVTFLCFSPTEVSLLKYENFLEVMELMLLSREFR